MSDRVVGAHSLIAMNCFNSFSASASAAFRVVCKETSASGLSDVNGAVVNRPRRLHTVSRMEAKHMALFLRFVAIADKTWRVKQGNKVRARIGNRVTR